MKVSLSKPDITALEIKYVTDVLKTPHLSLGPKLSEFEEKFAQYVGSKYAIAVNSGTSGLHLCVRALGISDGDEVITTPFSFIASANCLLYENATPVFVDIDKSTLNINPDKIEEYIKNAIVEGRGSKIKAILPVHVFGQPCEMDRILKIADKYNLVVIEDSCEALGAEYRFTSPVQWKKTGTIGKAAVFAFYPNKQITTGEGGIVVTDDDELASIIRSLRNQGRNENGRWLSHVRVGYNYRLSDINCALGIAQLERVNEILQKRAKVAKIYNEKLENIIGIRVPYISDKVKMSWFVYVVQLEQNYSCEDRNQILKGLAERGIGCNNYFPPLHLQPLFMKLFGFKKGDLPVSESVSQRTVALPFFNNLSEEEIEYVCTSLEHELIKLRRNKQVYNGFDEPIVKNVEYEVA